MKKLMKKTALTATAFALALMVALSLSGSLPATANSGSAPATSTLATTPTVPPTSGSGSGSVTASTCEHPTPNPGGTDTDCDGLIEIATFAQLNAIRYDAANGNVGFADKDAWEGAYSEAFGTNPARGCPIPPNSDNKPVCVGYELVADIAMTGTWTPISGWATTLEGNGHVISGMVVAVTAGQGGLISWIGDRGKIRNLGLRDAVLTLNTSNGGILAGGSGGEIRTSYATGNITYAGVARSAGGPRADVGGLVGRNNGKIIASWADVDIQLNTEGARAGGLVGSQKGAGNAAKIVGSVAYGDIEVTTPGFGRVGGFIGVNMNLNEDDGEKTVIRESYAYGKVIWDEDVSWNSSHPNTKTGVFGCNPTAEVIGVYYNDESTAGGCSPLAGRTSP